MILGESGACSLTPVLPGWFPRTSNNLGITRSGKVRGQEITIAGWVSPLVQLLGRRRATILCSFVSQCEDIVSA